MRFFFLLVVALAVTVVWQTTIGAAPNRVGNLDCNGTSPAPGITSAGFSFHCAAPVVSA